MIVNCKAVFLINKGTTVKDIIYILAKNSNKGVIVLNENSFKNYTPNELTNTMRNKVISNYISEIKLSDVLSGKFITDNYNLLIVDYDKNDSYSDWSDASYVNSVFKFNIVSENILPLIIDFHQKDIINLDLLGLMYLHQANSINDKTNALHVYHGNSNNFITNISDNIVADIELPDDLYSYLLCKLTDSSSLMLFKILCNIADKKRLMMDIFKQRIRAFYNEAVFSGDEYELSEDEILEIIKSYKKRKLSFNHDLYCVLPKNKALTKLRNSLEVDSDNRLSEETIKLIYDMLLNYSSYDNFLIKLLKANSFLDITSITKSNARSKKFSKAFGVEALNALKGVNIRTDILGIFSIFMNSGTASEYYYPAIILKIDSLTKEEIISNASFISDVLLSKINSNLGYTLRLPLDKILYDMDKIKNVLVPILVKEIESLGGVSCRSKYNVINECTNQRYDNANSIYHLMKEYIKINMNDLPNLSKVYMSSIL